MIRTIGDRRRPRQETGLQSDMTGRVRFFSNLPVLRRTRMEYRRLGQAGVKVSAIGFGSWVTFGKQVDLKLADQLVGQALDLGIHFLDTADVYAQGAAEEILGQVLGKHRRESIVLATKCYGEMGKGPNDRGLSRKHILEACHASLRRLQTEVIDLYQCH